MGRMFGCKAPCLSLTLLVHDVINQVTRKTINTKAHSLCHLCKTFGLYLMLEHIRWEIGAFAMYDRLDQCERGSL